MLASHEEKILKSGLIHMDELETENISELTSFILISLLRDNPRNYMRLLVLFHCFSKLYNIPLDNLIGEWKKYEEGE